MSNPEEEYEQASPEQKVNIANYFIQASPINEVKFVCDDVAKLVNDDKVRVYAYVDRRTCGYIQVCLLLRIHICINGSL